MLGFEDEELNEEALQEKIGSEEEKSGEGEPAASFSQEDIDQIITEMTEELLQKYQNTPDQTEFVPPPFLADKDR